MEDSLEETEHLILYDTQEEEGDIVNTDEVDPLAVDPSEAVTSQPVAHHTSFELPAYDRKVICTPVQPVKVIKVLEVCLNVMKDDRLERGKRPENAARNGTRVPWISSKCSQEVNGSWRKPSSDPAVPKKPVKMHECPTCGRKVRDKSNFNKHLRTHQAVNIFNCEICHCKFSNSMDLRMHMHTHSEGRPFKCDVCGVAFARSWNLKSHHRSHFGSRQCCDVCGASFNLLSSLKIHQQKVHNELPLFPCQTCGLLFPLLTNVSFSPETSKLLHCFSCSSLSSSSRKPPISGHTQNMRSFLLCADCGSIFEGMSSLQDHRAKMHKTTENEYLLYLPHFK